MIHLCGAGAAKAFAQRGFRLPRAVTSGEVVTMRSKSALPAIMSGRVCRVTQLLQVSRAERVRFHMPDCPGKRRASRAADRSPDTLRWLYDFDPAGVPSAP